MAEDVKHLNSFLRGELSAVETYNQALKKIDDPTVASSLQQCLQSHQRRVELLEREIRRQGGEPSDSSGAWGVFAKTVEGGAKALGKSAAISVLEEGEDHGRDDYKRHLEDLSASNRAFIEREILPLQLQTHSVVSRLQHQV